MGYDWIGSFVAGIGAMIGSVIFGLTAGAKPRPFRVFVVVFQALAAIVLTFLAGMRFS